MQESRFAFRLSEIIGKILQVFHVTCQAIVLCDEAGLFCGAGAVLSSGEGEAGGVVSGEPVGKFSVAVGIAGGAAFRADATDAVIRVLGAADGAGFVVVVVGCA
jgi:hypothetical protein